MIEIRRFGADDAALLRNVRLRALREAPEAFATRYEEASAQLPDYWTEMASESKTPRCRSWRWTASWASASSRAGCSTAATPGWPVCGWRPRRAAPALELSVTATDPTAAALYARAGFAETGRRRPLPADPSRTEIFLSRRL